MTIVSASLLVYLRTPGEDSRRPVFRFCRQAVDGVIDPVTTWSITELLALKLVERHVGSPQTHTQTAESNRLVAFVFMISRN